MFLAAMGIMLMCLQTGGAIAPLVIVPIQAHYGWRAAFYMLGAVGQIWCVAWYCWYRDTLGEHIRVTPTEIKEIGLQSFVDNHHLPSMRPRN